MAFAYFPPPVNRVVLYGGIDNTEPTPQTRDETYLYNPVTNRWSLLFADSEPGARGSTRMVFDSFRGYMVLFGGKRNSSDTTFLADTWRLKYDAVTMTYDWERCSTCIAAVPSRSSQGMAFDYTNDRAVMFGGYGCVGGLCNDTWTFSGNDWEKCLAPCDPPNPVPTARSSPALAWDGQRVTLFGGKGSLASDFKQDTWFWNGTSWAQCVPPQCTATNSPPKRSGHRMEYSVDEGKVVLFGGFIPTLLNDTWYWNGASWCGPTTPACTSSTPPTVRCCMGLAYVPGGVLKIVLYGGGNDDLNPAPSANLQDMWRYQNMAWECIGGC